ncbi:MAG: glutathione S-transferase family protein [Alphaproteobacteria bacterium]|nr:glutathione S-transferase family protein [Alphaproteobacteria bacterium]
MSDERIVWGIGTSRTIRAHWALIELGLDYRTEVVRTRTPDTETPEFVAINPRGKIPVLRDGPVVIAESPAIVMHLGENYRGQGTELVPEDRAARAKYLEWMSFISMELDATSLYVLRRHWSLPQIYGDSPIANKASEEYFARMINAAAKLVDDGRPYILGDTFSGIDILMMTTLDWAIKYHQPLPDVFQAYVDRLSERPTWIEASRVNWPT